METIRKFAKYYIPYKKVFFLDLFCALIFSAIDVIYPQVLRRACSGLFTEGPQIILQRLPMLAAALLGLYIVQAAANHYVIYQGHMMGVRMERDMRAQLFEHYEKLSFSYYDKNNTGQAMSRIVADLFDISEFAHHGPENIFISFVKILGSFAFMAAIEWRLALILLTVVIAMIVFRTLMRRGMHDASKDNRKRLGAINETLQDSFSGVRIVQAFGNEEVESEKFSVGNEAFVDSKRVYYTVMARYFCFNKFAIGMLYAAALVFGGLFIAHGSMTPADLTLFAIYIAVFVNPILTLIEFQETMQKGLTGFERFLEIIETEPEIKDAPDAQPLKDPKGDIIYKDVSFRYNDNEEVLEHVDLTIPAGSSVALAGPSGGGKTTICSLLPRFYDIDSGSITIGGQEVSKMTLASLRKAIGIVQQEVYMFGGTVRENIEYGKPGASIEEIIDAAKKAKIHDFVMSLPNGYDTIVGERGARLSGGQKQRISIARVFLKNPPILIFDEATSALDNESEAYIRESLRELAKGRTTITIAHRLSTIRDVESIYVIDGHKVAEHGTHKELMKLGGIYANYYNMQFEGLRD